MENDNIGQLGLTDLGTASTEDINQAMEGQPETVKPEIEEPKIEKPEKKESAPISDTFTDGLESMTFTDKDGYARLYNDAGSFVGGDLDQFGHRTMVTGLDKGFTFTGWEDTADRSAEAQNSWEKLLNGTLQFAGDTVLETTKGLAMIPGAVNALVQGDLTALYDNGMQRGLDSFQEDYDKYFEIKRGGNQTGLQKASNFLFDDILGAMSFVVGAVATEAILSAVTVGSGGTAAPAQIAATAGLAARGARIAKGIISGGKRVIKGQFIDDAIKGFQAIAKDTSRRVAGKGLVGAGAKGARIDSINAAGKLGRQILTGGGMEAGVEARAMMNTAGEAHKAQYEELYGEGTYTEQMEEDFRKEIGGEADAVFGANLALVSISNMLMFPRLFGVSLRRGMKTVKTIPKSSLSAAAKSKAAKAYGMTEEALPDLLDMSRGTAWGRNLRRTAGLRIGLYEGFVEEGGQGVIGRGAEHYIAEKYNPENTNKTVNTTEAFLDGLKGSYTTAEGFKEIAIGFGLGFLGVPNVLRIQSQNADGTYYTPKMMGGIKERKDRQSAKDKAVDNIINLHKKHGDVVSILESEFQHMNTQKGLIRQADIAYENNDFKQAKDIEANQIFAHATSKITTGRFDDAIQESKEILDDMSVEEYRELLGESAMNMSDSEVLARKEEVHSSYVKKMNGVKEAYDAASEIYRGENPDIHAGIANMIYNLKDKDVREKYIADSIAEKLKTFNGDQILDASHLASELEMTSEEVDEMVSLDDKIKRIEKQLKTKMERKIIKNIDPKKAEKRAQEINRISEELEVAKEKAEKLSSAIFSRKNIDGSYEYDLEKQEARLQGLLDMNRALKAVGRRVTDVDMQGLNEDVLDLMEVTLDRKVLIENYNDLIEPGGYQRFLDRMQGAIAAMYAETAEEKGAREIAEYDQRQEEAYEQEESIENAKKEEGVKEDLDMDRYEEDVPSVIIEDFSDDDGAESPFSDLTTNEDAIITDELYEQEGVTPAAETDTKTGSEKEVEEEVVEEPSTSEQVQEEDPAPIKEITIPEKILSYIEAVKVFINSNKDISALNTIMGLYDYMETKQTSRSVKELVKFTLKPLRKILHDKGYRATNYTGVPLENGLKGNIEYVVDETLDPGKTLVRETRKPKIVLGNNVIQQPSLLVARGPAIEEEQSAPGNLSVMEGETDPIPLTLDDPSMKAVPNQEFSEGAMQVLAGGLEVGSEITLKAGVKYQDSIDIIYNGNKIGYISRYEKDKYLISPEVQQLLSEGKTVRASVSGVEESENGGSKIYGIGPDKKTLVNNRGKAIDAVHNADGVEQVLFVLGTDTRDAVKDSDPLVNIPAMKRPDLSTTGKHYMIVKDFRTQKNVWIPLDGELTGHAEAEFMYQAAMVVDIFNGMRTAEAVGMTQKSYNASLAVFEKLGVPLEKAKEDITKKEINRNKRQFVKLISILTGYKSNVDSTTFTTKQFLNRKQGVHMDILTGATALDGSPGRLDIKLFDLDDTQAIDDMPAGTRTGDKSVVKRVRVSENKREAIVDALRRMKKSATTEGRDLHMENEKMMWPKVITIGKDNELVIGEEVPYKEWLLNRLFTTERAPIKANVNGNNVHIASNYNSIQLQVGEVVEERAVNEVVDSEIPTRVVVPTQPPVDVSEELQEKEQREKKEEEALHKNDEYDFYPGSAQLDLFPASEGKTPNKLNRLDLAGQTVSVTVKVKSRTDAEANSLGTYTEEQALGLGKKAMNRAAKEWTTSEEVTFAIKFGEEATPKGKLASTSTLNASQQEKVEALIDNMNGFPNEQLPLSNFLGITGKLGSLQKAKMQGLELTIAPPTQPTSEVEISSNAKGLAAALTNPTELAKSKGNLTQSYPITFNGKTYRDVEAAYQTLKDKSEAKAKPTKENSGNYKLMVDLISAKLDQHPGLISEITEQGGAAWIRSSIHQPTKQNTVWETGGQNWFIESLADAYKSTQRKLDDSVTEATPLPAVSTGTNMDRAGKLYGVEGMNARQVAMTVNVLSGNIANLLLTHSMTTNRAKPLQAKDLNRLVRQKLEGQLEKLKSYEQTEAIQKKIDFYDKVLEPGRFRTLMMQTFLEVLRINQGTIKTSGASIELVLNELVGKESVEDSELLTEDELMASENPLQAFDDNFAFGADPKNTLRFELKMRLLSTSHTELNAETFTPFGQLKYVDFATAVENLNEVLSGLPGEQYNWDSVKKRLEGSLNEYGYFKSIIKSLDVENYDIIGEKDAKRKKYMIDKVKQMRQQLVTFGAKDAARMIGVKLTPSVAEDKMTGMGGKSSQTFTHSSNYENMQRAITPLATGKLLRYGIYKVNPETENLEVDPVKVEALLKGMDAITSKENTHEEKAKLLSKFFYNKLGITIPADVFSKDEMHGIERDLEAGKETNAKSIFGKFRNLLRGLTMPGADLNVNLLTLDKNKSGEKLFTLGAKYDRAFIQNSSRDISGKVRHQHSAPKLITQRLNEIKMQKGKSTDWVDEGNYIIKATGSAQNREKIQLDYVDGLNMSKSTQDARGFHGMTESDRNLMALITYGNELETYTGNKKMFARHMLPTIGDKHTMPLINIPAIITQMQTSVEPATKQLEDLAIGDFVNDKEFGKYYNKYIKPSVDMEINRINKIRLYKSSGQTNGLTTNQLKAEAFVFIPQLTEALPHDKMLDITDIALLHKQAKDILHSSFTRDLQSILTSLDGTVIRRNPETGLINGLSYLDPSVKEYNYIANHLGEDYKEIDKGVESYAAFLTYVAKFTLDSFAAKTNTTTMFVGDPGAFWKNDAKGTMDNTGKRFASMIAPGNVIPQVQWNEPIGGGKVRTRNNHEIHILPIADQIMTARNMTYLKSLGLSKEELSMYQAIEATDGAEFVTAEEHLSILLAQGVISELEFNGLLGKARDPNAEFTQAEKGWFQPMKPVTAGRLGSSLLYIKSAQFPLVAAFTKDSELDKLRVFMEENRFHRAAHESAFKVGNTIQNPINIYKKDGTIDVSNPELKNQRIVAPRHFIRIQQEQPIGKKQLKVHGSQVAKLNLATLTAEKGFVLDTALYTPTEKDGTFSGAALHKIYIEARQKEINYKIEEFGEKYGLSIIKQNGSITLGGTLKYKRKIATRMYEEAVSRGYEANELAHLYLDEATGEFATPLWASLSEERVNSLILSIFHKEVLQPQIAGFSGAIKPETGIGLQDITKEHRGAIVWTYRDGKRIFDGKGLKASHKKEDGTMQPDQIIMPWKYKGKLSQFTKKDKEGRTILDMDKVPADLLNVFAYRIPGQKKASSGSFEVVGFAPAEYGDGLIVPTELVGRIGQDFDIDKLYGMMYQTSYDNETGALTVIREENAKTLKEKAAAQRNIQMDVYHSSMRNPSDKVQKILNTPVSDGYAEDLANIVGKEEVGLLPMSIAYNNMKAESAQDAKQAIGVFASTGVTHAQLEQIENKNARGHFGKSQPMGEYVEHISLGVLMEEKRNVKRDFESYEDYLEYKKEQKNSIIGKSMNEITRLGKTDILDTTFVLEGEGYNPVAGTVQEQYSRLINHAVDNENNHLLAKLGIHRESYPLWSALTEMGYNQETISMIALSPIALSLYALRRKSRSFGNSEIEATAGLVIRKGLMEEGGFETKGDYIKQINFNKESLKLQYLNDPETNLEKIDDIAHSLHILDAIETAEEANRGWRDMQKSFSLDTKLPKSRQDFFKLMRDNVSFTAFQFYMNDPQFKGRRFNVIMGEPGTLNGKAWSRTKASTVSGQVTYATELLFGSTLILEGEHIENTAFSQSILKALEATGSSNSYTDIIKSLKSYLSASWAEELTGRSAVSLRKDYLDSKTDNIAIQLVNAQKAYPEVANNLFIKQLIPNIDETADGFHTLQFTGDRNILVSTVQMQAAFLDLVTSENVAVRKLAETLFVYDLITGGTLKSRGYGKYIPAEYLQDMPDPQTREARPELGIRSQFNPEIDMLRNSISSKGTRKALSQIYRHNPKLAPKAEIKTIYYLDPITKTNTRGKILNTDNMSDEAIDSLYKLGSVYDKGILYTVTGQSLAYKEREESGELVKKKGIIVKSVFENKNKDGRIGNTLSSEYSSRIDEASNAQERIKKRLKNTLGDDAVGIEMGDPTEGMDTNDLESQEGAGEVSLTGNLDNIDTGMDQDFLYPVPQEAEERVPGDPTPIPLENHVPLQAAIDALFPDTTNFVLHWALEHQKSLPIEKRIKIVPGEYAYMGAYNNTTNTLKYNKKFITAEQLAHEVVHAYTVDAVNNKDKYPSEIQALIKEIEDTRKVLIGSEKHLEAMGLKPSEVSKYLRGHNVYTKAQNAQLRRSQLVGAEYSNEDIQAYDYYTEKENQERLHGFVNEKEFMSEALTNPIFAKQLNEIKLNRDTTLYEVFLDYISGILKKLGVIPKGETAATLVIRNTMQVMEAVAKETGVPLKLNKPKADTSGLGSSENLEPDSTEDPGKFDEKDLETLKRYKQKRIRQFNEVKARFKDNAKLVRGANQRIALERMELNGLEDEVNVLDVVEFGNRELDNVERILSRTSVTGSNMNEMQSAIQDTLSVIEFYENLRDLSNVSSAGRKELAQLQARAKNLRSEYLNMSRSLLRAFAKKRFKGTDAESFINSDSFLEMENIGSLSAWFMDASRQGRIEFSFLDGIIKDAQAAQQLDFNTRVDNYKTVSAAFKETEYYKKHGWNGIVQLDADGNPTAQLISPLSNLWDRQQDLKKEEAIKSGDWGTYYKWRDSNTGSVNVNQMYKIVNGEAVRTNNVAVLRQLEKKFGKLGAQEILSRQDILMQDYASLRQSDFDVIDMEYPTEQSRNKAKAEWEAKYSPGAHYSYKTSNKRAPKGSRNKFLYHMPLLTKGGKSTGYYDSRFIDMQSDPAAVEYYEFIRSQFKEMMAMLPTRNMGADSALLQNGLFIPALRKQMTLDFWDIPGKLRKLKDSFLRAITSSEQELESNLIDPVTGEIRREIPTRMLNAFAETSEQEYDMDKVFAEFTMMATTYNSKNKVEDIVTMTDAVLNEVGMKHLDGKKDRVTLKGFGLTSRSQERRSNILTVVRTLVDDFYGKKVKEPMIIGSKKAFTTEDKLKEAGIKEGLNQVQALYKDGSITEEEFKESSNRLNTELSKVGGYVDISKLIRGVTQFMQLKGMGWNITAATVNGIYGSMQVWRWANGREDFDEASTRKAATIMMGSTLNAMSAGVASDQIKNVKKIQNMMMKLNVLKDYTEVQWDATKASDPKEGKRWLDKVRPYHLQKTSEYFVYGLGTVSHLLFMKVDGVSLWEAMDEEGVIQIDGYRPGEENYTKLVARIDQFNKGIHGNYDPDSPIAIKKTMLGPMLMQFRSWLPEGVAQRGQEAKFDAALGRDVKGTFRTFGGQGSMTAWKSLPKLLIPFISRKEAIDGLSSVDEANVRKTAASVRQLMWLSLMIGVIKNALDDDDDNSGLIYMLNVSNRIERDLTFFHNPYSIQEMSKDALPVFKLARDVAKFGESTLQTLAGDGTIPTGIYAGRSRMLHHGGKLIPFTGAAMKLHHNIESVME